MNIEYIKLSVGNYNVLIDSMHVGSIIGQSKEWQLIDIKGSLISEGRTRDQAVNKALADEWQYSLQELDKAIGEGETNKEKYCNYDEFEYNNYKKVFKNIEYDDMLRHLTHDEVNSLSNELKDGYIAHYKYMMQSDTTVHVSDFSIAMVVGGVVSSCAVYFDNPMDSCLDKSVAELYHIILDTEFKEHEHEHEHEQVPVQLQAADTGLAEDYQPVAQRQSKLDKLIGKISRAYRRMVNAIKLM